MRFSSDLPILLNLALPTLNVVLPFRVSRLTVGDALRAGRGAGTALRGAGFFTAGLTTRRGAGLAAGLARITGRGAGRDTGLAGVRCTGRLICLGGARRVPEAGLMARVVTGLRTGSGSRNARVVVTGLREAIAFVPTGAGAALGCVARLPGNSAEERRFAGTVKLSGLRLAPTSSIVLQPGILRPVSPSIQSLLCCPAGLLMVGINCCDPILLQPPAKSPNTVTHSIELAPDLNIFYYPQPFYGSGRILTNLSQPHHRALK